MYRRNIWITGSRRRACSCSSMRAHAEYARRSNGRHVNRHLRSRGRIDAQGNSTGRAIADQRRSAGGHAGADRNGRHREIHKLGALVSIRIYNDAKTKVCDSGLISGSGSTVSFTATSCTLAFDAPHTWRVRAEYQGGVGPWSANAAFQSPAGGYIRGNELFDPLTNGPSTVMTGSNDVTWLPGLGVRLNSKESYVEYRLQQPCVDCEMSALMTNLGNGSEEWKTKVMSMLRGDGVNITDNDFRVTLDKRTTWVGQQSVIRYTMCFGKQRRR